MNLHAIVTTFNPVPSLLERAVVSALRTPGVERLTIVDDGSLAPVADPTGDSRVEVVRQANAGPSAARNAGLDRSRGDFAVLLDDDDEFIAEGVTRAVELARSMDAAGALVGRIEARADGTERRREAPPEWAGRAMPRPGDAFRPIQLFNASGTIVARRAIERGLRYDTSLWVVEDREFIRRLADVGPIAVAPGFAVRAGVRPGGERLTSAANLVRRARGHEAMMAKWLDTESEAHFRELTLWLLNAMSKAGLAREEIYRSLYARAAGLRWIGPLRAIKLSARAALGRAPA